MSKKTCLFCGSERYYAKGYCKNCYARIRTAGTPEYRGRGQKVDCFSAKTGEFLATYENAALAAESLGLSRSSVTQCIQKKCSHAKNYLFKKSDGTRSYNAGLKEIKKSVVKEVYMKRDGAILETFKTVREAAEFVGGSRQGIHQVINKEKHYKGYTWSCVYELKSSVRKEEEVS